MLLCACPKTLMDQAKAMNLPGDGGWICAAHNALLRLGFTRRSVPRGIRFLEGGGRFSRPR